VYFILNTFYFYVTIKRYPKMALVTTGDWQTLVYKLYHLADNSYGFIPRDLVRHEGVSEADLQILLANYAAWKQTQPNRIDGPHQEAAR
jgi:hypothetical protein